MVLAMFFLAKSADNIAREALIYSIENKSVLPVGDDHEKRIFKFTGALYPPPPLCDES
jgi:hypothetical protein